MATDVSCDTPKDFPVLTNAAVRHLSKKTASSSEKILSAGLAKKLRDAGYRSKDQVPLSQLLGLTQLAVGRLPIAEVIGLTKERRFNQAHQWEQRHAHRSPTGPVWLRYV